MKNKFTTFLTCFTIMCAIGATTACSQSNNSGSVASDSSVSASVENSSIEQSEEPSSSSEETSSVENSGDSSVENSEDSSVENSSEDSSSESTEDSSSEDSSSPEVTKYTITFVDYDGTQLSVKEYEEGATVEAPANPTRDADNMYTYTFNGWDKTIGTATADVTYTATYTATEREYTVTFLDADGSEISSGTYHYGDTVTTPNAPARADSAIYTYTFTGWDSEVVETVAGNATYTAVYAAAFKSNVSISGNAGHTYGVEQSGEGVVLKASNLGNGANYTKGQQAADGAVVHQSYIALDGEYNMDDYVAFDFTGKNMPEVAFFANNYDDSMYANGTDKQGIVVITGITDWQGGLESGVAGNGTQIRYGFPYMIQDAADGGFIRQSEKASALGRANLVDDTHYRVIMGFEGKNSEGTTGITLHWYLYNLDTNEVVEQASLETWNFFSGSNAKVGNMTVADLSGSIVLYGKFGAACTIDKIHGVYQNASIESVADGLMNNTTYTVTFQDENGNELQSSEVAFGQMPAYEGVMPTPATTEDFLFTYTYEWDKEIVSAVGDAVYQLKVKATAKQGITSYNTTVEGDSVVLGKGGIGDGANYTKGQNNGGYVDQAYLALDGNYGLDNYIVFDFTGKNMPEIAFFANNYNESMYAEGTNKEGIVVVTGITTWDGNDIAQVNTDKAAGTVLNYGFPYMVDDAANGGFCQGAFQTSALGRANLVDGKHYRVIMGFTGSGNTITLNWCLYDLDTNTVVETSSMTTWGFFSGSNAQVGNMTINDLSGSIVLYGKFGTTCTVDKIYEVENGAFETVVAKYATNE